MTSKMYNQLWEHYSKRIHCAHYSAVCVANITGRIFLLFFSFALSLLLYLVALLCISFFERQTKTVRSISVFIWIALKWIWIGWGFAMHFGQMRHAFNRPHCLHETSSPAGSTEMTFAWIFPHSLNFRRSTSPYWSNHCIFHKQLINEMPHKWGSNSPDRMTGLF